MAMAKPSARTVDLEPIDRLEDKLKRLVAMVERMKAEQSRATEENLQLTRELESLRDRLTASEAVSTELSTLKEEREIIRSRVGEMLDQLEALNV